MEGLITESSGKHFGDDTMMSFMGGHVVGINSDQDPTVQCFRPIFTSLPFSKVSNPGGCEELSVDFEGDMDDDRPQSARTVEGYCVRDSMDIDSLFTNSEPQRTQLRPFYGVHEDCFAHVLRFLPLKSLCLISRVSRDLRRTSCCDTLWIKLCQTEFGVENAPSLMEKFSTTIPRCPVGFWKKTFRSMLGYKVQLVFTGGPRAGETQLVMTNSDGCMIGRSRQNNICILQDEMVSRRHAKISRGAYHFLIQDVGSINGTFVNQKQLTRFAEQRLFFGDQVDMGNSVFRIDLASIASDASST